NLHLTTLRYSLPTMGAITSLKRLRELIIRGHPADKASERVQRILVKTLYTQPASLALGALTTVTAALVAAWVANSPEMLIATAILGLIAAGRVLAAFGMSPDEQGTSTRKLELIYETGAFSYALVLGIIAAMAMLMRVDADAQIMIVANALCYGVGVAARNAGRPSIAIGQLGLVSIPITVACFLIGSASLVALAVTIMLLVPAMMSITLTVFKVLRDSINAAETSALLADKMQDLARTDVVTGLANRAGLNHSMVETMMAIDDDTQLALFWIDLDRFKEVNDLLGHPVRDRVLSEVAKRLKDVCPEGSTVSRFGGDQFVMFCPIAERKQAELIASEIHAEIMRPIRIDGNRLEVRASVGVAVLPDDGA
ncbi:MAG: GGDEF domain-containing protein, partial [Marinomonas sp.]